MNLWREQRWPLVLRDGEIHVWKVDLDRVAVAVQALKSTLAPAEPSRVRPFNCVLDRRRQAVSYGVLRNILAGYLCTAPAELEFRRSPDGKPELAGSELHFNLARSDGMALYAVSRSLEVGIDVEHIRAGVEEDLAGWLLPPSILLLAALTPAQRQLVFFQSWTRMEAYSKALGVGLARGIGDFESFLFLDAPPSSSADGPLWRAPWWIHDFLPDRGYAAALAARGGSGSLSFWKWRTRISPADNLRIPER
ncbi:MAG TPA: 4'-phosphopantetheinyl transferase superfamily protein [Bryobacteraceae bacterium]|nr:4'-phosphopantetheinyl transferase superfamily protein [Bryobacteraceae bacterium]